MAEFVPFQHFLLCESCHKHIILSLSVMGLTITQSHSLSLQRRELQKSSQISTHTMNTLGTEAEASGCYGFFSRKTAILKGISINNNTLLKAFFIEVVCSFHPGYQPRSRSLCLSQFLNSAAGSQRERDNMQLPSNSGNNTSLLQPRSP